MAASKRISLRRLRDLLLYVAIGFAFVWLGFYQAKTAQTPGLPLKWLGFAGMTALVFGDAIQSARNRWRSARFWLVLTAFFVVQSCVGIVLLSRMAAVPLIVYVLLTPLNYLALESYLHLLLGSRKD